MKLSELAGILSFRGGGVEVVSLERDRMVVKRAKRVRIDKNISRNNNNNNNKNDKKR